MTTATDIKLDEKIKKDVKEPPKYKVILLNDDQTPMDWVVSILTEIYKHSRESAEQITMTVHTEGSSVVGVYTYEIAEQKITETITLSRNSGFPLQLRMEEDS
jgi:ATP-dependent Clp protease adaptor protein ClpS